jgi:hypothetical protein
MRSSGIAGFDSRSRRLATTGTLPGEFTGSQAGIFGRVGLALGTAKAMIPQTINPNATHDRMNFMLDYPSPE